MLVNKKQILIRGEGHILQKQTSTLVKQNNFIQKTAIY